MNPKLKLVIELIACAIFAYIAAYWFLESIDGDKPIWFGAIGLLAMLYWITVFTDRWKKL
jgi:hypothetical protein